MGFRSGLNAGQPIFLLVKKLWVTFAQCIDALSCWNVQSSPYKLAPNSINSVSRRLTYFSASILIGMKHVGVFPMKQSASHIMTVPPPNPRLKQVCRSWRKSLQYCLQLSGASKLNLFSSLLVPKTVFISKLHASLHVTW